MSHYKHDILSVEKWEATDGDLYDITVEDVHSFHCNDVIIHNSNVEFGTGLFSEAKGARKQRIYPKNKQALAWTGRNVPRPPSGASGDWRALAARGDATIVRSIAGMRAQPFMRPAISEIVNKEKLMETLFRLHMDAMRIKYGIPAAGPPKEV